MGVGGPQESGRWLENRNREESELWMSTHFQISLEIMNLKWSQTKYLLSHEKARQSLIYSRLGIVGVCKKAKGGGGF